MLNNVSRSSPNDGAHTRGLMIRSILMVSAWFVVVLAGMSGAAQVESTFQEGGWEIEGAPSFQLAKELENGFVGRDTSSLVLEVTDHDFTAGDADFNRRMNETVTSIVDDSRLKVSSHVGYTDGAEVQENFLGEDDRTTLTMLGSDLTSSEASLLLPEVQSELDAEYPQKNLSVALLSADAFWGEINQASVAGLAQAELIALPLIIVVLLLLYRSVAATVVSLVVTGVAIIVTLGILVVIGQFFTMSSFTLNAVTMLGLGVCIDYSLFIVRRFQQELQGGFTPAQALATTRKTAVHAVVASGLTIAVAMSMLFLVDLMIIQSLALGVVAVVIMSLLVCVFLLPALLTLLGHKINWGRIPGRKERTEDTSGQPSRIARVVTSRPVTVLLVGIGTLGLLAVPAAQLTTFTPDVRIVDPSSSVRQGYDRVADTFSVGATAPIQVLISAPDGLSTLPDDQVNRLVEQIQDIDGVTEVTSPLPAMAALDPQQPLSVTAPDLRRQLPEAQQKALGLYVDDQGDRLLLEVLTDDWPSSVQTQRVLHDVENVTEQTTIDHGTVLVGGQTAQGIASNQQIAQALPWAMLCMIVVIGVLLAFSFKSLLIPLIAVIMNLLSVGATYGIMVLVFQWGWGAELLGYMALGYIQNFVPVLLLALLFSLATDYQVFLISRIREEWAAGRSPREAIAHGLTVTAPLISGAALLMVVVFGAFSFTGIVPIQQLGFGLAVGIFLDATVVRMLLVPAALSLVGKSAWWWPSSSGKARHKTARTKEVTA
ncbi:MULTISPECIES: MMPL family transporter [Kocuria]|uniref:MMPL family transporter n=1 Tax=Kocuria subflava TaxID=1736139 RepID=A0A846U7H2_9MICC|nr:MULTISPECIES: efflux RND transporter permease subunit [Kocuria]NKE10751.1 MMPL family transporter [Kocuria subflava]